MSDAGAATIGLNSACTKRRHKRRHVVSALEAYIRQQGLRVGDRLAGEPDLARHFGVARITLRRAADRLVERRVLERRNGVGTFGAFWGAFWGQAFISH